MASTQESRLDRIIELSKSILDQLGSEKRLSDILPQARLLAEMNGDAIQTAWLDNEIYGRGRVPAVPEPYLTLEQESGVQIFDELHMAKDPKETSAAKGVDYVAGSEYKIAAESISILEQYAISEHPEQKGALLTLEPNAWNERRLLLAVEFERILSAVRAAVHQYVSEVWLDAVQEKENLALVGLDYQIVLDNLDALETGVGQELKAALDTLRSDNPANWKLAALGCRNVIIKLGDNLWKVPCKKYLSELDSGELDLLGEREKNRLYAYIDCHHKRIAQQEHKDTLKTLHGMVWGIYDIGSKAKRSVRHEEAKTVVVDTFEFVNQLDKITELKPLEAI